MASYGLWRRVPPVPSEVTGSLAMWMRKATEAINAFPRLSYTSFTDPNSNVTGGAGDVLINKASNASISRMWIKQTDTAATTGWVESTVSGAGLSAVNSVAGTVNRVTVSPTTGACVVDISSAYVGQSTINVLNATQANVTTCANLVTVGALASGSIVAGFGGAVFGGDVTVSGSYLLGVGGTPTLGKVHVQADQTTAAIILDGYLTAGNAAPAISFRQARGTLALPASSAADDTIGGFHGRGYGATGFPANSTAGIDLYASEGWTDAAWGSGIKFRTTVTGGTSKTEKMRLQPSGGLSLGAAIVGTDPGAGALKLAAALTIDSGGATITAGGLKVTAGNVGIGVAQNAAISCYIGGAITTGANQYGLAVLPTVSSAATGTAFGAEIQVTTAAASFTVPNLYSLYVYSPAKGAGSAVTNNYAIYVAAQSAGATLNYAFYSAGAGLVGIGDTTDATSSTAASTMLAGGLGVAKALYVGTTAHVASDLYVGSTVMKVDIATTRVGINTASPLAHLHVVGESMYWDRYETSAGGFYPTMRKARGTSTSPLIVANNDQLGKLQFQGYDGNSFAEGARIIAEVDGTPGDGDMPTRLVFYVTPDGAEASAEAFRLSNTKVAAFACTTDATSSTAAGVTLAGGLGVAKALYVGTTLTLSTAAWDDVNLPLASAKVPAANYPAWAAFSTNLYGYTFAVNDYIDMQSAELPHGYKAATYIEPHVHIVSNGSQADECNVRFRLYYSWGDTDPAETMSSETSVASTLTIPSFTTDRTHFRLSMGTIAGTGYKYGSLFKSRLMRIARSSGTDPAANPFVEQVGIHYQKESLGTGSF